MLKTKLISGKKYFPVLILIISYISFFAWGITSPMLGATLPTMRQEFGFSVEFGGLLSATLTAGILVASYSVGYLLKRFGIGFLSITATIMMSSGASFISYSGNQYNILMGMIALSLGAGTTDAALNDFISANYSARYINWLHAVWGIGAIVGPQIMAYLFSQDKTWHSGFKLIWVVELGLLPFLIFVWVLYSTKKAGKNMLGSSNAATEEKSTKESFEEDELPISSNLSLLKLKSIRLNMISFTLHNAFEGGVSTWIVTYFQAYKLLNNTTAVKLASYYYIGITVGRIISGLISSKVKNKSLIRIGAFLQLIGTIGLIIFPSKNALVGLPLVISGLGAAPLFPLMLHRVSSYYKNSLAISPLGFLMASGATGALLSPIIISILFRLFGVSVLPIFLGIIVVLYIIINNSIENLDFNQ